MNLVPLDFMQPGESASIYAVDGRESGIHRLAELGIRQGVSIQMVRPGTPCILKVGEQRFTLRLDPDMVVMVALGEVSPAVGRIALGEAS